MQRKNERASLPNSYLTAALALLYTDSLTRECLLRMSRAPNNAELFGKAERAIGSFFDCFATEKCSKDAVLEVHEALLPHSAFKPYYGQNKLQKYVESLLETLDSLLGQSYLGKCLPKDGDHLVGTGRNSFFKIGLIASRFATHCFQTKVCLNCNVNNEKHVQKVVNVIEKTSLQPENSKSVVAKFASLFKHKDIVEIEEFMAKQSSTPIDICCQVCNGSLAQNSTIAPQQSFPEVTMFAVDNSHRQLLLKDKVMLPFGSEASVADLSFVCLDNRGDSQSVYCRVTKDWLCIKSHSVLQMSCSEFNKVLSRNGKSVIFAAYRRSVAQEASPSPKISAFLASSIKLPLSVCCFLKEQPKQLSFALSQLFCDHFKFKPAAFNLDYTSSDQLSKSAELALREYEILSETVAHNTFMEALYKSNLLSKYGCHFDQMANLQVCETCMRKERKRTFIDGLQLSLKLKIIENKTKFGSAFIKNNKEMVELTFSNDFAKRVGDNVKRTGNLLGIKEKENCDLNNDFDVLVDGFKLTDSHPEGDMKLSNFTFKGKTNRFETLIGPFEDALIKSIASKSQISGEIDMNGALPKLKAAMNAALNVTTSGFAGVEGCKQLQADIQQIATQTSQFVPKQSLQVPVKNNYCDSPILRLNCPLSPTDAKFVCPQIITQKVDFVHKQQHAESLFKRKPVNRSGDKKHCSAVNQAKNSKFPGKKLMLDFGFENQDFEFWDNESGKQLLLAPSVTSSDHNYDIKVSPGQIDSVFDKIEMSEFNQQRRIKPCLRKGSSKTPVLKRTIWPAVSSSESPNVNADFCSSLQSRNKISNFNDERADNESASQRADTPAVQAHVHFFEEPISVRNDQEEADISYRLGCIKTNKKSKFVNPQNNSILTDISRSEISSVHRSIYEILTMKLEAEAGAKKSTNQFHRAIVKTASRNLKTLVRQCGERLAFECKVRMQHNIVKPAPVAFMLTIKKDKENVQPAPKVINLAKNELSNQKRGLEWTALGDIPTNSENFSSPAQRQKFNQSSIEKAAAGNKDFGLSLGDPKRNVFLERLEEVSEETKKSSDSRKEVEDLRQVPVLSLCKIDLRFAPLALPPSDNDPIGRVFREDVSVFCMPKTLISAPLQPITIGIENKKLDGSPIGCRPFAEPPKERLLLAARQTNSENNSRGLNCSTCNESRGTSRKPAKQGLDQSGRKEQSSKTGKENSVPKRNLPGLFPV